MILHFLSSGKLSAGTRQRARPQSNRNTARRMKRGEEVREVEESQSLSSADSCGSSGEGGRVTSCDGADGRLSGGVASEDDEEEKDDDDERRESGRCFLDGEAEEVWSGESSEEEMEWSGESGEEEEEGGFVLGQCRETGYSGRRCVELESSCEDEGEEREGEKDKETAEEGSDDGANREGSESGESEKESGGEDSEGETCSQLPSHLRWKEGLVEKARQGFEQRLNSSRYLHKLIYCDSLPPSSGDTEERKEGEEEEEELGGLFHVARRERQSELHSEDSSLVTQQLTRDWMVCVAAVKRSQFVTGSWGEGDAAALLQEDQEEEFGDFEDLETGEGFGQETTEGKDKEGEEDQRLKKKKEQKVCATVFVRNRVRLLPDANIDCITRWMFCNDVFVG